MAVHAVIVAATTRRERDFSDEFTGCSSPGQRCDQVDVVGDLAVSR
jgi:hypothetical protein